jgi:hypothetical protein
MVTFFFNWQWNRQGRKCTEAWKFIKKVRTSEKESVHLQMIPTDRWVQYYQNLLTENRPEYEGTKNITPIQMVGEIVEVKSKKGSERTKKWEIMWTRSSLC